MNGIELAKRIRRINSNVRIIVLSEYYIKNMLLEDKFRDAKITEVLLKPIHLSDLGAHIIKLCSNKQYLSEEHVYAAHLPERISNIESC